MLTAFVFGAAYWFICRRQLTQSVRPQSSHIKQLIRRYAVNIFLCLLLLVILTFGIWHWFDGQQQMKVVVMSPLDGRTDTYRVRKKDINGNNITTINGIKVRFSGQERITIAPLTK